jgi:hypothetical protein
MELTLVTALQTSLALHHPQHDLTPSNACSGSATVVGDARLYKADADQEPMYDGW